LTFLIRRQNLYVFGDIKNFTTTSFSSDPCQELRTLFEIERPIRRKK
jgi:hypothetical protein